MKKCMIIGVLIMAAIGVRGQELHLLPVAPNPADKFYQFVATHHTGGHDTTKIVPIDVMAGYINGKITGGIANNLADTADSIRVGVGNALADTAESIRSGIVTPGLGAVLTAGSNATDMDLQLTNGLLFIINGGGTAVSFGYNYMNFTNNGFTEQYAAPTLWHNSNWYVPNVTGYMPVVVYADSVKGASATTTFTFTPTVTGMYTVMVFINVTGGMGGGASVVYTYTYTDEVGYAQTPALPLNITFGVTASAGDVANRIWSLYGHVITLTFTFSGVATGVDFNVRIIQE